MHAIWQTLPMHHHSCVSPVCELPVCVVTLSLHVPPASLMPPSIHPFTDQPAESVSRFKQWFWSVVEKMTNAEKHDLVRQLMIAHDN